MMFAVYDGHEGENRIPIIPRTTLQILDDFAMLLAVYCEGLLEVGDFPTEFAGIN